MDVDVFKTEALLTYKFDKKSVLVRLDLGLGPKEFRIASVQILATKDVV